MSGTLDAMILEKAVELWRDPANRLKYISHDGDTGYCALGALRQAEEIITGRVGNFPKAAARIGYDDWEQVALTNDASRLGQRYLYWRMKRALKKARA